METNVIVLCGIVYIIAFAITALFVPFSISLAHKTGAIDVPKDDRRVHTRPIPRIGGVAMFLGISISAIIVTATGVFHTGAINEETGRVLLDWNLDFVREDGVNPTLGIVAGGAIIFVMGLIDDLKDLSPKVKLLGQIAAASFVYAIGVKIKFVTIFFGDNPTYFSEITCYLVTVIWIVAITNTINLVDGLDGLAGGVIAIASLCIAYVGYIFGYYTGALPMLAIAGSAMGFLPYNFYPAKTFMGDCGSQYLGFMLASFSIVGSVKSATVVAVLVPGLALSLPIIDTLLAIVRRAVSGKPIMQADKGHLHHRLLRAGMGQRRTVLCLYGVCAVMGTAAVLFSRELYVEAFGLCLVALLYIYVVLTGPNKKVPKLKETEEEIKREEEHGFHL